MVGSCVKVLISGLIVTAGDDIPMSAFEASNVFQINQETVMRKETSILYLLCLL